MKQIGFHHFSSSHQGQKRVVHINAIPNSRKLLISELDFIEPLLSSRLWGLLSTPEGCINYPLREWGRKTASRVEVWETITKIQKSYCHIMVSLAMDKPHQTWPFRLWAVRCLKAPPHHIWTTQTDPGKRMWVQNCHLSWDFQLKQEVM